MKRFADVKTGYPFCVGLSHAEWIKTGDDRAVNEKGEVRTFKPRQRVWYMYAHKDYPAIDWDRVEARWNAQKEGV